MLKNILLVPALVAGAWAVQLSRCNNNTKARLADGSLSPNDAIFFFNGTHHMSDPDNIQLTIDGCKSACNKPNFDLYDDMWPRLLTWLFPILLMIGNLHLPKVGAVNRILVVVHFIGDPIDSMWSLLTKGESWNRFYHIALRHTPPGPDKDVMARAFAAMLSAFDELTGQMGTVQADLEAIMAENAAQLSREDMDYILKETADELVDNRSNEVLRSALVIINYLWTVLASLVPSIGGEQSSKPGGRIGTAMFLSWLVTAVMLSNTLSGFTSRRTCLRIMERYCRTIKGRKRDLHVFPNSPHLISQSRWIMKHKRQDVLMDYFDSQPWNGSVYSYRKNKHLISSGSPSDKSPLYLFLLSFSPLVIAIASAFIIIFYTPNVGLGCRTVWVMSLGFGLLVSPFLTYGINKIHMQRVAWYLVVLKDMCIAIPTMVVIILSSIGVFNTCWCWSAVYSRGYKNAFVILDPLDERTLNGKTLYPAMTGACLILQIIVFALMHHIMKPGGRVFRLKEEEKNDQYRHVHGDGSPDEELVHPYRSPMSAAMGGPETGMGYPGGMATGMGELELPPAAISPQQPLPRHGAMLSPTLSAQRHVGPATGASDSAGTGYFSSPTEWRTPEQPLLGEQPHSPYQRRW